MSATTMRIEGRVVERRDHRPVAGLRVEAWDQDKLVDDFVGRAERTDDDGRFTIRIEHSYFEGLFGERRPDLYFRVFGAKGDPLAQTAPIVRRFGDGRKDGQDVVVDVEIAIEPTAEIASPVPALARRVVGSVRRGDGGPAPQMLLRAFRARGDERLVLGEALSDAFGRYALQWTGPDGPVDLIVHALDARGDVQGSAQVRMSTRLDEVIDVVLGDASRRPNTDATPGRAIAHCRIDLPPDDVVERTEFERFIRLNLHFGDFDAGPAPSGPVINAPMQPGAGAADDGQGAAPNAMDIRTLPLAFYLPFTQTWRLEGYTRGRLVKSFALAPGEEQTVEVFTWDRQSTSLESTLSFEQEQSTEASGTRRDTGDVARDVSRQTGFEMTTQGKVGFQVGVVNVDLKTDATGKTALNEAEKSTRGSIVEATSRSTQRVRTSRTLKVTETRERGSEERVTRKLRNPNASHTMTVAFFEILSNYETTTQLDADNVELVVLIPSAELAGVTRFDRTLVRTHESTLRLALLDRALADGFDAAKMLDARDRACAVLCKGCECDSVPADTGSPEWAELVKDTIAADKAADTVSARKIRFPFSIPAAELGQADGIRDIQWYLFQQSVRRNAPFLLPSIQALGIDPAVGVSQTQVEGLRLALALLPPEALARLSHDDAVAAGVWSEIRDAILATLPSVDPISFGINYGIASKRADDLKAKCGGFNTFDDGGLVAALTSFGTHYDQWLKSREAARLKDEKLAELARIAKEERDVRVLDAFGLRETAVAQERLAALLDHLNHPRNRDHYRFAIWNERSGSTDETVMSMALSGRIDPTPVGIVGDQLAVPVRRLAGSELTRFFESSMTDLRGELPGDVNRYILPTAALHCEALVGDCACIEEQAMTREQLQTWRMALDNQIAALEVQRLSARLAASPPLLDRDVPHPCPPLDIRVSSTATPGHTDALT